MIIIFCVVLNCLLLCTFSPQSCVVDCRLISFHSLTHGVYVAEEWNLTPTHLHLWSRSVKILFRTWKLKHVDQHVQCKSRLTPHKNFWSLLSKDVAVANSCNQRFLCKFTDSHLVLCCYCLLSTSQRRQRIQVFAWWCVAANYIRNTPLGQTKNSSANVLTVSTDHDCTRDFPPAGFPTLLWLTRLSWVTHIPKISGRVCMVVPCSLNLLAYELS